MDDLDRAILRAYAQNRMSAKRAAKDVYMSTSGVEYRLKRIRKETGLDPRQFFDLVKLLGEVEV